MSKFNICLWFLLICMVNGIWSSTKETLNIEMLPYFRVKQYSLQPYKKVVIFSASRTGSSLVYNVFRFLFEDEKHLFACHNQWNTARFVLITHNLINLDSLAEENVLYILAIRHPIVASISHYRIEDYLIHDLQGFAQRKIEEHKNYLVFAEEMKEKKVLLLKCEDFENDVDALLDLIEKHFFLMIDDQDRNLIKQGYSKENVSLSTQQLLSFEQFLPISGFHGHHVALKEYVPPYELIFWLHYYFFDFQSLFKKYGYGVELDSQDVILKPPEGLYKK